MTTYVLSGYPLSRAFQQALEARIDTRLESIHLLALRQSGLIGMLRSLLRLRGRQLYIAYEDPTSIAILPVLHIAAALTRIRNRFVVDHNLRVSPMQLTDATKGLAGLVAATAKGFGHCWLSMHRARQLLQEPRVELKAHGQRVLYLNANLWFGVKAGGSVGHISGVVNAFSRENHQVLFCSAGGRLMVHEEVGFKQLDPPRSYGMPWVVNSYSFDDYVARNLEPLARQFAPSFLYQRMSLGNYSGVRLSRLLGVPLILEYNGSEVWVARNWGRSVPLEKAALLAEEVCLKHAQLVVTVSNVLRDELLARGVEESRVVTYPNCIDPEIFDPARFGYEDRLALRRRYGIEANAVVVTFLGSFGHWHGVPILAEAIRRMIEKESAWLDQQNVRFLLVGDGMKMGEVRAILGNFADGKYVKLTGLVPQDEAPVHLAASDILSSPHVPNADGSRFFGSPTKLFEYMAMGRPIVASDLDQIGDVLRQCVRVGQPPDPLDAERAMAVLCKPGSVEEHADGVRFLVNNPGWRQSLGTNARREALRRYTWSSHVRQILTKVPVEIATDGDRG